MSGELVLTDSVITAAVNSPLTVDYAKQHIRALGDTDDLLVQGFIDAATNYFEEMTGRQLVTATREVWLDAFPFVGASGKAARIELPNPPLLSVGSVSYIDGNGVLQSFDDGGSPVTNYFTSSVPAGPYARRGFVEPIYGYTWPIARCQTGAVRIRYTCGYGSDAESVPAMVRHVLCSLVAHFDANRLPVSDKPLTAIPFGIQMALDGFKYSALPSQLLRQYATWIPNSSLWWPR
jgi:uncharacterized phiE125 gp8 family phage protein